MWGVSVKPVAVQTILGQITWRTLRIQYRAEHALRWCAAFFGGVIIFGVNNTETVFFGITVEHLHLVFTALAIMVGYTIVLFIPSDKRYKSLWRWVLLAYGVVSFFAGFLFDLYSITWAELLVALPITFAIYKFIQK
jgi:hypothetical protein